MSARRVRAGAFADEVPARDLLLSPDHAVYIDNVLIPAGCLINGRTILRDAARAVLWWHIELPRHDALFAEGLPCESYLNTDGRAAFRDGGKVVQLYPRFGTDPRAASVLAPFLLGGEALASVRRYLLDRSAARSAGAAQGTANRFSPS